MENLRDTMELEKVIIIIINDEMPVYYNLRILY